MTTHKLKTWPEYFQAIKSGVKTFELRKFDRDFKVGDLLLLREWDPKITEKDKYTGNEITVEVTYLICDIDDDFGLEENFVIMAVTLV